MDDHPDDGGREDHRKRRPLSELLAVVEEDNKRGNEDDAAANTEAGCDHAGPEANNEKEERSHGITIRTAASSIRAAKPLVSHRSGNRST